jgi:3',5'-nucleoside bisphosphate phosphatase
MHLIDLHTHSYCSDGTCSPVDVVKKAAREGVALFSLSDHDTVEGLKFAREEAKKHNLPYVNGVEISTDTHDHLHILGYGFDHENKRLLEFLEYYRNRRMSRIKKSVKALQEIGLDIDYSRIAVKDKHSIGRAHVADYLKKNKMVSTRQEAFVKYLIPGKPGYLPPVGAPIQEAVSIILESGGIPVLAHPGAVMNSVKITDLFKHGIKGIEAYYPAHRESLTANFLATAKQHNLIATGGSDYHGPKSGKEKSLGIEVANEIFENIKTKIFQN